ncbi:MAG: molybdenum cofactor guanylyltransferase MobA [Betaproteobacteria bacterium]|nr:molybdenum cofactor guanylyltransferase MobA [Betaproteobacteria bacterium]
MHGAHGNQTLKKVTALVLAGGRGSRMGEVDKGLQIFNSKPMVAHVIERLQPQCDELIINANRNLDIYAGFGHRVVPDAIEGFAGPLAGLHIGMTHASHPLIVTAPCDSPFLPLDLVARLRAQLDEQGADLAVAKTFDQPHPVFCLTKTAIAPHLHDFLAGGQRKIDKWYASLKVVEVPFDDEEAAFANINTVDELRAMESKAAPHG